MTAETLTLRASTSAHREYVTSDGDLVIARRAPGGWLVTATANDPALTQVQGLVTFNEAGFAHRQWESTVDGQQHPTLIAALREAVSLARQRADIAAFAAVATPATGVDAFGRASVWTYRAPAIVARDEEEARLLLTHEAGRLVPEDQASITILSMRRTPTGRWSAMIKRVRS